LVVARGLALIEEHWPLIALYDRLDPRPSEQPLGLPDPHRELHHWAVIPTEQGRRVLPLAPLQARMLASLVRRPVAAALAEFEASIEPERRTNLPAAVQRWLAESVEFGFWVALEVAE
jgi:hypothetical protein